MADSTEHSDLSILTESTQLLSNTHESWAQHLEKDIEQPLVQTLHSVLSAAQVTKVNNGKKMDVLGQMLQKEEELSYKMGKKMKGRDMGALQYVSSLASHVSYCLAVYTHSLTH